MHKCGEILLRRTTVWAVFLETDNSCITDWYCEVACLLTLPLSILGERATLAGIGWRVTADSLLSAEETSCLFGGWTEQVLTPIYGAGGSIRVHLRAIDLSGTPLDTANKQANKQTKILLSTMDRRQTSFRPQTKANCKNWLGIFAVIKGVTFFVWNAL